MEAGALYVQFQTEFVSFVGKWVTADVPQCSRLLNSL